MQASLRFIGVLNAGIWLGAAIVVSFVVLPVIFSPAVTPALISKFHAGRVAQLVSNRYLVLHVVCATIALLQVLAEKLYSGRAPTRLSGSVLGVLAILSLVGAFWLAPKMERLHLEKYDVNRIPAQQEAAARQFGAWHGVSQITNLVMLAGILFHFSRTTSIPGPGRNAAPATKRGY